MLISAFRATLEEVRAADVIVHVRDISHADSEAQSEDVEAILEELGIADRADRVIEVWNKLDRLGADERAMLAQAEECESQGAARGLRPDRGGDRPAPGGDRGPLARGRALIELTLDAGRRPGPALALRACRGDEPPRPRRRPAPYRARRARSGRARQAAVREAARRDEVADRHDRSGGQLSF